MKINIRLNYLLAIFTISILTYAIYLLYKVFISVRNKSICLLNSAHFGKQYKSIESQKFIQTRSGHYYSFMFWINIDNWEYKLHEKKHIFSKGDNIYNYELLENVAPAVLLDSNINNMIILVTTEAGVEKVMIKDIEIGNWNHIAIVCTPISIEIYKNGKLYSTTLLHSLPLTNFSDLHICSFGGFGGYVADLKYASYSYKSEYIFDTYKKGPKKY